jgi:hypothetical protein
MADLQEEIRCQGILISILRISIAGGLVLILKNLLEASELVDQLRYRIGYHGTYGILDYQPTLDIRAATGDGLPFGHKAVPIRKKSASFWPTRRAFPPPSRTSMAPHWGYPRIGRVGVEPTRPLGHRFLRPTRMPFRHRPLSVVDFSMRPVGCQSVCAPARTMLN